MKRTVVGLTKLWHPMWFLFSFPPTKNSPVFYGLRHLLCSFSDLPNSFKYKEYTQKRERGRLGCKKRWFLKKAHFSSASAIRPNNFYWLLQIIFFGGLLSTDTCRMCKSNWALVGAYNLRLCETNLSLLPKRDKSPMSFERPFPNKPFQQRMLLWQWQLLDTIQWFFRSLIAFWPFSLWLVVLSHVKVVFFISFLEF